MCGHWLRPNWNVRSRGRPIGRLTDQISRGFITVIKVRLMRSLHDCNHSLSQLKFFVSFRSSFSLFNTFYEPWIRKWFVLQSRHCQLLRVKQQRSPKSMMMMMKLLLPLRSQEDQRCSRDVYDLWLFNFLFIEAWTTWLAYCPKGLCGHMRS